MVRILRLDRASFSSLWLLLLHWTIPLMAVWPLNPCFAPVSIWEPFCKESKVYAPYIRVFHKGRNGALIKDRGPGFLDLSGMADIYVCTNGLTMMYYAQTTAMGTIYEQGELHWVPHHCELYNPSCNIPQRPDFPRKILLSVLLMGHPQDYRIPSLQMFTAPFYDPLFNNYVNLTSLIMIGNDGECLIEKGEERARLRVRLMRPKVYDDIDTLNTAAGNADPPKSLRNYPTSFCRLDAHRKLGQGEKPLINLKLPDEENANATFVSFYEDNPNNKAPLLKDTEFWSFRNKSRLTGSTIEPRFRTTDVQVYANSTEAKVKKLAELASYVYAALLSDRPLKFTGCFRYPLFNSEQAMLIFDKGESWEVANEQELFANYTPTNEAMVVNGQTVINQTFWMEPAKLPWDDDPNQGAARFKAYLEEKNMSTPYDVKYADLLASINTSETNLEGLRNSTPPDKDAISKAENDLKRDKIKLSLWPYIAIYSDIANYLHRVFQILRTVWAEDARLAVLTSYQDAALNVTERPFGRPLKDYLAMAMDELSERRLELGNDISRMRQWRQQEPYNPELEREQRNLIANYTLITQVMLLKGQKPARVVSNVEALTAKYLMYRDLLNKAHENLKAAVLTVERTKKPARAPAGGDPLEKIFTDTIVEIADAMKLDGTEYKPEDPEYLQARACQLLPTEEGTCDDIRPTSRRASKMLQNRKGKGLEWPVEDVWRKRVIDLIEEIFNKVCPYISVDLPISINRIIRGYLLGDPLGTGLTQPVTGSRLEQHDNNYQGEIYNSTYVSMAPNNETIPPSAEWKPAAKLNPKKPFWDIIVQALEACSANAVPLQFWHNEEGDKPVYITFRKFFPNNNTELHYDVEELYMREKAEMEYAFNWAIDVNWKMFATVLGYCSPNYETKIPLITTRFYALYSQDFLFPLRQIWMSNRDNPILTAILGSFNRNGIGDKWINNCMEASYVESGDRSYRPPRYLYVNAFSEMNYFTSGPMAGTSGILSMAGVTN